MALTKIKKSNLLERYKEILDQARTLVYVKFKGLTVKDTEVLRRNLFQQGISYTVVKKTLWERALLGRNFSGQRPEVKEEMAVIAGGDLFTPARIANDFAKSHKTFFGILGGVFDGAFKDMKSMMEIASLPPREVLLAKMAFLLKSPLQKLVVVLDQLAKKK